MIRREQARAIAESVALARQLGTGIRGVYSVDELPWQAPTIYGSLRLDEYWIGYVERPVLGLGPSTIVLVSKQSGQTRYAGSGNDEG